MGLPPLQYVVTLAVFRFLVGLMVGDGLDPYCLSLCVVVGGWWLGDGGQ